MSKKIDSSIRIVQQFKGYESEDINLIQATNDLKRVEQIINKYKVERGKPVIPLNDAYLKALKRLANQYINLLSKPTKKEIIGIKKKFKVELVSNDYRWNLKKLGNSDRDGGGLTEEDWDDGGSDDVGWNIVDLIKAITGVFPVKKNYGYIAKIPISNWKQQKQTTIYQILSNIQQNYSALKQLDYSQFKMLLRFKTNLNSDKWSSSQKIDVDSGMVGAEFITLYDKEVIEPMYYDSNKVNSKSFIQNSVKIEKVVEINFVFYHD